MPIHGSTRWLSEALESVRLQTYDSWEFIAYLDGPNPEAERILTSFGPRFTWVAGKEKVGSQVANNRCIELAKGTYVARLDSDDKWDSNHLLRSVEILEKSPELVLLGCPARLIDDTGAEIQPILPLRGKNGRGWLLFRNQFGHSGTVFLRTAALKVGLYNPKIEVSYDYALWLALATQGKTYLDSSRFFYYRVHPDQMSGGRLSGDTLRRIGRARATLANHLGLPVTPILLWHLLWRLYRQIGPVKALQASRRAALPLLPDAPVLPDNLRIMHVINSLDTGGAERIVVELCDRALKSGHRPFIVCLSGKEGVPHRLAQEKEIEVTILTRWRFSPMIPAKLSIAASQADIVHSHLFPSIYWSSLLKKPKVLTEHNTTNRRRSLKILWKLERRVYQSFDRVVAISGGAANSISEHLENLGVTTEVTTIMNSVSDEFRKPPRAQSPSAPKIVFIGSLTTKKDPLLALRVMVHLPGFSLNIVGSGPLRKALTREIERLDLESRVKLLGEVDHVPELLASHDLLLSTSVFEGFGLVALEAQSSGMPVVGPNVAGLKEVVIDGVTGYLFHSREPQQIATLVQKALEPEQFLRFSQNAVWHSNNFSLDTSWNHHLKIYEKTLGYPTT